MTSSLVRLGLVLVIVSGCTGLLGAPRGRRDGSVDEDDAASESDARVSPDAAALGDGSIATEDAFVLPGVDAGVAIDAYAVTEDAALGIDAAASEMCPVGPAATRTYPATWADGECIVQWSHDGSITRARYWTSPEGERVLYAEMGTNFCSADLLGNLLGTIEGRWATLAFPNTPPWEGGRSQPMPDCAHFHDGDHVATWSFDGSDIRARRSPSGVLYAENDSGGTYAFVPGHWVGAAGGTGTRNEDLCFAEEMP